MNELLEYVKNASPLEGLERIDRAPLDQIEYFIEHGAPHVHRSRIHAAKVRRLQLCPSRETVAFPSDKAAFLAEMRRTLEEKLASGPPEQTTLPERVFFKHLPGIVDAAGKLAATPCKVVEEGALFIVEQHQRLHDATDFAFVRQDLFLFTGTFSLYVPHLMVDGMPLECIPPDCHLGRKSFGKAVGDRWEEETLSVRGQHIVMGMHAGISEVPPEEKGAAAYTVIACA